MKEDREECYWGRFADSYDRDGEYVVGSVILRAIEEKLLKERSLGYAVEFGCGTGYFTRAIAGNATQLIATDLSGAMLEVAQKELEEFGNVTIEKADCRRSSFPAERFDTVVMINVIHIIYSPSQCFQEANRIMKHPGMLIVVDFTGHGMSFRKKMSLVLRYMRKWGRPPRGGQNDLSPEELACLAEESGFEVKDIELLEGGANALYLKAEKR